MKYIRMGDNFIVFSDNMVHREEATKQGWPERLVHSAGFVCYDIDENGKIEAICNGDSFSLKIGSRADDSEALTEQLVQRGGACLTNSKSET